MENTNIASSLQSLEPLSAASPGAVTHTQTRKGTLFCMCNIVIC